MLFFTEEAGRRVAAGCLLALLAVRGTEARDDTKERSAFYLQAPGISERRVLIELTGPGKSSKLYERIAQRLKGQGWTGVPKSSGHAIRDRCLITVSELKTSYELVCMIFHEDHVDVVQTEAYGEAYLLHVLRMAVELREHPPAPLQAKGRSWM